MNKKSCRFDLKLSVYLHVLKEVYGVIGKHGANVVFCVREDSNNATAHATRLDWHVKGLTHSNNSATQHCALLKVNKYISSNI